MTDPYKAAEAAHAHAAPQPPTPSDDVWEALQRLIENAAALGPASREDAIIVARWRGQFIAAREGNAGVDSCGEVQRGD
jgi:hypothetical protein